MVFAEEPGSTNLIGTKGGSSMHEQVFGTVDDVFEKEGYDED